MHRVRQQCDRTADGNDADLEQCGHQQDEQADLDCSNPVRAGLQGGVHRIGAVVAVRPEYRQCKMFQAAWVRVQVGGVSVGRGPVRLVVPMLVVPVLVVPVLVGPLTSVFAGHNAAVPGARSLWCEIGLQ